MIEQMQSHNLFVVQFEGLKGTCDIVREFKG